MKLKSKYSNKKIITNEGKFDSKKEYKVYQDLLLLQKAGEIATIERQVKYVLIPPAPKIQLGITYNADFVVTYKNGLIEVIDAKGFKTKEYIIKKKLMYHFYKIIIR